MKPFFIPKVSFQKPTIGPKDYVAAGPSGWPERFARHEADQALDKYIAPVTRDELLANFTEFTTFQNDGKCTWSSVTNYLGELTQTNPDRVPFAPAIAMWSLYLLQAEPRYMHAHADPKPRVIKFDMSEHRRKKCETEST